MIRNILNDFVEKTIDKRSITVEDMAGLQAETSADDVMTRETIDVLVALDRAVTVHCEAWDEYLVAIVVDFAVWTSRPTGLIDKETANWLITTLSAGQGPTSNAMRIAFEIVREAERCDEALVSFAMRRGSGVAGAGRQFHAAMLLN